MEPIQGVYAAAVTPRREGPEADLAATLELVDFLSRSGVAGIAMFGATGEFPHFTIEERSRLFSLAAKRSRVPLLANVSHSTLDGAVALARDAAHAGAAALLVAPPHFFRYSQDDILGFYQAFAREAGNLAPVLLYNLPMFGSEITCETALELLRTGRFAGIKDSSGRWEDFLQLQSARQTVPFSLLVGHDALLARARAAGASGVVSGVASALPELIVALDRAASDNGSRERLDARLHEFLVWAERFPVPVAIREAASARGLTIGIPASPQGPRGEQSLHEFREWFRAWLPVTLKECANGKT